MIDTAVILAAGVGTRLGADGAERPKGFITLGEKPIIEESVARLRAVGIGTVVIVTGHLSERYEELARRHSDVIATVHNERYADSGSMYSLYLARSEFAGPFLLLESDLIYEPRALTTLLDGPEDAILLSGNTGAGDEVYVETRDGLLVNMSKQKEELAAEPAGELVGLTRISPQLFEVMLDHSAQAFRRTLKVDYETDALVAAARSHPIHCPVVDDLVWAEIDDAAQMRRARSLVYPRLRRL